MLIQGEPERAPNTQETGSGVYFYLFVRDLTHQRHNAHAQISRGRPLMVKVITNAVDQMVGIAAVQCGLISRMIKSALWSGYWVISITDTYLCRVGAMAVAIIHGWHDDSMA